ncbi:hypothetical protein PPTG_03665 [Phytophthora nicotianae INRA-310]|uniref:Uncharacterized protein n=1 Tax=Phytophthora nicotianae (strain INRA-310) TaxID=761204 RepID=W2R7P7_PHYN3|nr:hypothetical protein PPTG_03665 [Phytophthora nicotianae INRA-310]ETN20729.1 hypothetical protein PPTG_03665 [Phytophthora nicotianae INRA-310]
MAVTSSGLPPKLLMYFCTHSKACCESQTHRLASPPSCWYATKTKSVDRSKRPSGVFCDLEPPVKPPPYVHTSTGRLRPTASAGAHTSRYRQSSSDEQSTSASARFVPVLVSVSTPGHSGAANRRSPVGTLANRMFWYL